MPREADRERGAHHRPQRLGKIDRNRAAVHIEPAFKQWHHWRVVLVLGVGVGWLESEFAALGVPYRQRGRRTDEAIAMLKALCAEELPPNAHAGVRASLALMHNVVTGLALEYEHLTDLGT